MLALIVHDLSPQAHGGPTLRNRALAHAYVQKDAVLFEVMAARRQVGCLRQCETCAVKSLNEEYGSPAPDPFSRNYCRRAKARLFDFLTSNDIHAVVVSDLRMHQYVWVALQAAVKVVIVDLHNAEAELTGEVVLDPIIRPMIDLRMISTLAESVRLIEDVILDHVSAATVVSELDRDRIIRRHHQLDVSVVVNGVDTSSSVEPSLVSRSDQVELVYTGHMGYLPNVEAVIRFATNILPVLTRTLPSVSLLVAGRSPTAQIQRLNDSNYLQVIADPQDTTPLLRDRILVVPLRVGGGSRLKVLEGFAAGATVVSTTKGAEGLSVRPDVHFRLVKQDEDWRKQLRAVVADPEADLRMRRVALEYVRRNYSWDAVGRAVRDLRASLRI